MTPIPVRVIGDQPPVGPLPPGMDGRDPYTNDLPGAERMTQHAPDERCLWVARHRVADCTRPKHPGYTWDPTGKRWVLNPRPGTAADLSEVPNALARPEPPAPWETQP